MKNILNQQPSTRPRTPIMKNISDQTAQQTNTKKYIEPQPSTPPTKHIPNQQPNTPIQFLKRCCMSVLAAAYAVRAQTFFQGSKKY